VTRQQISKMYRKVQEKEVLVLPLLLMVVVVVETVVGRMSGWVMSAL